MQLQEPTDPTAESDEPGIQPEQLIEELEHSRLVLHVVEYDGRLFDEHCRTGTAQFSRDVAALVQRRDAAQAAIHSTETDDTGFLRDMFVRFGRGQQEALAYGRMTVPEAKSVLKKKIMYLRRKLDAQTYRRLQTRKQAIKERLARERLESLEREKREAGETAFKADTSNTVLNRLARETRQMIEGINGTLVYVDLMADMGRKLGRVRGYLGEDANRFESTLINLEERIRLQEKEMTYLANVFAESSRAKERAEKSFASTSEEMRRSERIRDAMLRDVQAALEEHKAICRQCMEQLVTLNATLKSSANACPLRCDPIIKPFPHALSAIRNRPGSKRPPDTLLPTHTELQRTFATLLDLTKAGNARELVQVFRGQVRQAQSLDSSTARLDHLLRTVLRPEFDMFQRERQMLEARSGARHDTLLRTVDRLQEDFQTQSDAAQAVIHEQQENVNEFTSFMEILFALNQRVAQLDNTTTNTQYLREHPGLEGLLDLTVSSLQRVVEQCKYFHREWGALRQLVDDPGYLEYRQRKLPAVNNRVLFDSGPLRRRSTPVFNEHFITNAQLKDANMELLERARLAEVARLKAADLEAEREKAHHEKMAQQEKKPAARKKH
ncbi:uncharacterized protein LOC129593345 [Paramacrobiotus metropolitanus]|uniref:uncharacterized protein LOC129593345 n=1 Tax=Paramacrobiotus metropolitanus TaxID=2943436 RepID=UPI002445B476|nr:uncharacterized protein LOC129593345 [Paramacrobiotus metropolitanus]